MNEEKLIELLGLLCGAVHDLAVEVEYLCADSEGRSTFKVSERLRELPSSSEVREWLPMRIGTSHFTSRDSAVRYYAGQRSLTRAEAAIEVQLKLQDGEIQIGPPNLKPGERYVIDPVEGRYFVFEDRP